MKRLVAMMAVTGAAIAAVAMPTKAALQKAQKMVSEVTAADVKALKAKTKTPAEVAAKHMELAGQAGNEAEKYVLLQGAFKLYAKAGDYEGAANALGTMNREIADMNPEIIVEIYNKAIFSSMKEKAPKLFAIKEAARRQVFYRKQLAKAEAAVKANPKDSATQKKLGECYAELGNWPKALDAFALAGGALAKTAAAEKDGTAVPQVSGDFWWDYESGDEMSTYKLHAAELYRAALADDSFKGLARTRTEQRVKEAEKVAVDLPQVVSVPETVVSGKAPTPKCKMVNGRPALMKFELAKGVDLELEGCPMGNFEMGYRDGNKASRLHKVKITRPFWLGKYLVTRRQWMSMMGKKDMTAVQQALGGLNAAVDGIAIDDMIEFCKKMNQKFAGKLPRGYVFRFPTDAEWEYACKANANDVYSMVKMKDNLDEIGVHWEHPLRKAFFAKQNLKWDGYLGTRTPVTVGLCKPNAWGFYDMTFNCWQVLLDVLEPGVDRNAKIEQKRFVDLVYDAEETDPVIVSASSAACRMMRGYSKCLDERIEVPSKGDLRTGFRVCLGPDLIAEKKPQK